MGLSILNKILWFARVLTVILRELIDLLDPELPNNTTPPTITLDHQGKNRTIIDPRGHLVVTRAPCPQSPKAITFKPNRDPHS